MKYKDLKPVVLNPLMHSVLQKQRLTNKSISK